LDLHGTDQLVVCADDVNLVNGNINIKSEKMEILIEGSKI
jgi:lipopolysaccharide export system protein LptA